jgi:predicted lipoprotein with Yx(FWY)xxD motif
MFARSITLAAGAAVCGVLLSACTGAPTTSSAPAASAPAASSSAPASSAPAAPAAADPAALAIKMADSSLGSILVDGTGMTLYMFTKDTANTSNCSGQCLAAWPALSGKPTKGAGVDDSKLGSFQRADGSTQATYNGWPLYYWKGDMKPGDVSGQNVSSVWFVLDRDGNPIKK